jgi:PAS domain S-box-containing protein
MSLLRQFMESGASFARTASERRNIILTNAIAGIGSISVFTLISLRLFLGGPFANTNLYMYPGALVFLVPVLLNRNGYTLAGRLAFCWLTTFYVVFVSIATIASGDATVSTYIGSRYYLLALCCPPFLIFDIPRERSFLAAFVPPLASLILFDPFMDLLGYGYNAGEDLDYSFNNMRALVSVAIIGSACYMLKSRADRNEEINARLIAELADKNEEIRLQASNEVNKLNEELVLRLQQLSEREFILNQSQRIARIGSWEYTRNGTSIFWSDEMYSIFGLDASYDIHKDNLADVIGGEEGRLVVSSIGNLLKTGEPLDITFRSKTPIGYTKWLRLYAYAIVVDELIVGVRGICHDITYYKEAEELLRASDRKYRSIFEQASDAILMTDLKGNFIDANTTFCSMLGYRREELLGMNLLDVIDPEDLKHRPVLLNMLAPGVNMLNERRMVARDGTIRDVEANITRMNENNLMAIVRDVTELRKAQRQIQISEAKFRGAFEYSAIGMTLVSLEGRYLRVNREFASIVGYTEEELLGRHFRELTHPADVLANDDRFNEAASGAIDGYRLEKRYVHRNGNVIWANLNVSMIKDEDGVPIYFVAQIDDITQEKKAKEKLMVSQANMNATINNTKIMIWSIDRQFRLLTFNETFRAYTRKAYNVEPRVGELLFGANPPPEAEELVKRWKTRYERALSGESFELEETRHEIDFHYSVSPIVEGEQIIGASIFAENITKRTARERELTEANKKINELRLMALRSVMSPHFIFNVLNSIQYFIAKNDRLNAINYLSTFSKLIRSILNHSVYKRIPLAEELEMLRNYVQLESTRFEHKFDFVLDVSPDVEVETVEIPSLLIQPYVENAILHGLYNKRSPGTLWIRVAKVTDNVVFEIEDDGVGRAEAMKLRQRNLPGHQSLGLKLTEERLKLIRQENHAGFEVDDLTENGAPSGTRVRISIPCDS